LFRLRLFGGASIDGSDGPLTGRAVQRRRLALLALLAVARGRGLTRDRLLAYLWPDSDPERARHLLSDSVYRINQALGGDAILAVADDLRINPDRLASDVWEFGDAIEAQDWTRAVELHSAPFLDGFFVPDSGDFDRWADGERERHRRERARALDALACAADSASDHAGSVRWWRALAADDPYSSRVALQLMLALERAGDRAAAVRHAHIHRTLLREELGVEVDPEVLRMAERLRTVDEPDAVGPSPSLSAEPAGTRVPASSPPDAPPDAVPTSPAPLDGRATAAEANGRARGRRVHPLVIGSAALLLGAVLVASWRAARPGAGDTARPTSIAVLPFEDLSAARDQEYFADGITEELLVRLSRVEGLDVVGRMSSFAFKGGDVDVREVAQRLGVGVVVGGSVLRSGNRLRIFAHLIDATDGYQLWSDRYERDPEDVFAIQDEIARAIVTRLRGRLAGADVTPATSPPMDDPEAYNLYLRGRFEWHKRTEQGLRGAAEYFRRAIERAPGYARATAGLADAYAVMGFYDLMPPSEAFPLAAEMARHALELDPGLAEPHATLAYVALYHDWDFERAEAGFRRTIELEPGFSTGHQWYANLLTALGRFDEAVSAMRVAQDLDPLSLIANAALGWVHYHQGDYQRAIDQFDRTLELDPQFVVAHVWRALSYEELGDGARSLAGLRRAVELSGGGGNRARLARASAIAGDTATARALLRELEAREGGEYVPAFEIAKVHEALGDRTRTLRWLERAQAERSHSMVFLAVDPQLRRLRDDPVFRRLVREMGLEGVLRQANGRDDPGPP
jgi:TolB-like protein/DNA-binding SARP family transcriptional activator/Tfp pilus assembly protein PilF